MKKMYLDGKYYEVEETLERIGIEVPLQHLDAVATDREGPDYAFSPGTFCVLRDNNGKREVFFPPHFGGFRFTEGVVYRVHDRKLEVTITSKREG